MTRALRQHWPEYFMEAACLGAFMISAGLFTALLEYPISPVRHAIPNDFVRLALNGLGMGLTAIGIIYSPWGARSGAHMNPAVTWTFFRLRKVKPWDALFYPIFQTLGGIAGVLLVKFGLGRIFTDAPVRYVVTVPGKAGVATAFVAEMAIACGMMLMVQFMTNTAVELYRALRKGTRVACAKWNHAVRHRCIFCGHPGIQRQKLPT